jgi:hypothetical protein
MIEDRRKKNETPTPMIEKEKGKRKGRNKTETKQNERQEMGKDMGMKERTRCYHINDKDMRERGRDIGRQ